MDGWKQILMSGLHNVFTYVRGVLMARKHPKRGNPRFIMLLFTIIESDAYQACSSSARDVYVGLLLNYNGHNNGYIGYGVRAAAKFANCGNNTAAKALKRLEEVGLIKCMKPSVFATKKSTREWAITHEPVEKHASTNEWRHFKKNSQS